MSAFYDHCGRVIAAKESGITEEDRESFRELLSIFSTGPDKLKQMAMEQICKHAGKFGDDADQAFDTILNLCESTDASVRATGTRGITQLGASSPALLDRVAGALAQLISLTADDAEKAALRAALAQLAKKSPAATHYAVLQQCTVEAVREALLLSSVRALRPMHLRALAKAKGASEVCTSLISLARAPGTPAPAFSALLSAAMVAGMPAPRGKGPAAVEGAVLSVGEVVAVVLARCADAGERLDTEEGVADAGIAARFAFTLGRRDAAAAAPLLDLALEVGLPALTRLPRTPALRLTADLVDIAKSPAQCLAVRRKVLLAATEMVRAIVPADEAALAAATVRAEVEEAAALAVEAEADKAAIAAAADKAMDKPLGAAGKGKGKGGKKGEKAPLPMRGAPKAAIDYEALERALFLFHNAASTNPMPYQLPRLVGLRAMPLTGQPGEIPEPDKAAEAAALRTSLALAVTALDAATAALRGKARVAVRDRHAGAIKSARICAVALQADPVKLLPTHRPSWVAKPASRSAPAAAGKKQAQPQQQQKGKKQAQPQQQQKGKKQAQPQQQQQKGKKQAQPQQPQKQGRKRAQPSQSQSKGKAQTQAAKPTSRGRSQGPAAKQQQQQQKKRGQTPQPAKRRRTGSNGAGNGAGKAQAGKAQAGKAQAGKGRRQRK